MPFVETSGQRLYYEDSGGAGPAVAFSHGFLLDHSMFDAQVAALSGDFRCITWDERGHGMSDCNGSFDFYDSANDLVAILDDAGVDRATLVGMSQGGFLSQRLAVNYPDRVRALVLIDTAAALFSAEELAGYQAMADAWTGAGPVGELSDQMAGLLFGPDYDASAWIGKWRSKPPADTLEPWRAVLGRDEFLDKLGMGFVALTAVTMALVQLLLVASRPRHRRRRLSRCGGRGPPRPPRRLQGSGARRRRPPRAQRDPPRGGQRCPPQVLDPARLTRRGVRSTALGEAGAMLPSALVVPGTDETARGRLVRPRVTARAVAAGLLGAVALVQACGPLVNDPVRRYDPEDPEFAWVRDRPELDGQIPPSDDPGWTPADLERLKRERATFETSRQRRYRR